VIAVRLIAKPRPVGLAKQVTPVLARGWDYDPASYAGVDLTDQDSSWVCPTCQATIDHFQLIVPADDDLTDADEAEEDSGVSVNPAEERPILARSSNPTIDSMKGRYDKGRLIPQPDFQRYQVWPRNKQSRLIESILLDLPLPLIYLAEEPDGRTVVIDGQQRLMAIFDYLDNKYPLKGLGPTKNTLDKSYFRDLDETLQGKIEDLELSVVEIKRESDAEIRFELFERLNTGATSLNDQELRNCVYRGDYNDFIKDLATDATFRKLLGLKDAHARMADVELVLRFMAFRDQTYLKYPEKKTKGFLNKQMELGRSTNPRDQQKAAKDFKQATQLALTVFGDRAFKKYTPGTSQNPNGSWARANNRALMDVQL
jgi:Protein of unknown function DUF262